MIAPRLLARRAGAALSSMAAVVSVLASGACTSDVTPGRSAPSLAAIGKVLTEHAAAVRAHDRARFMADVSDRSSSAAFRQRQQAQFAALRSVPLAAWSYRVEGRTDDRAAEHRAGKRYGASASVVRIDLRYALRGVDSRPSDHELWWTFVQHDGTTVIAGDDDLANAGGTSWRGPWDFGTLSVIRTPSVLLLAHTASAASASGIAQVVSAAIPAVSAVWGYDWSQRVAVLVPGSAAELTADVGQAVGESGTIAALAVVEGAGADETGASSPDAGNPGGAGSATTAQRLVVDPAGFDRLSGIGRRIVVRHEVTHIAAAGVTGSRTPRWLVEGFADYVGNLHSGQPVTQIAAELAVQVRRGRTPVSLPDDAAFDMSPTAAAAYAGAWLACRLVAERIGQTGLVRFYRTVGASTAADPVPGTMRAMLHETPSAFTAQWRAYVRKQLA